MLMLSELCGLASLPIFAFLSATFFVARGTFGSAFYSAALLTRRADETPFTYAIHSENWVPSEQSIKERREEDGNRFVFIAVKAGSEEKRV